MKLDGSAWAVVGSAGFSAGPAFDKSLSFAPDGTPFVAYSDIGNSEKLTVMKYNGNAWVIVGSAGFSAGGAYYLSLSIAPDGTPFVAYADGNMYGKITVKRLGNAVVVQTVISYDATDITATSATLTGTFNSNGAATAVSFTYGNSIFSRLPPARVRWRQPPAKLRHR